MRVAVICRPARLEGLRCSFLTTGSLRSLLALARLLRSLEACLTLFASRALLKGIGWEKTYQAEKQGDSEQLDFLHWLTPSLNYYVIGSDILLPATHPINTNEVTGLML